MKLKSFLAASTALAMLTTTGVALAGNTANIIQLGDVNVGSIDQSAGDGNWSMFWQNGDGNTASVVQNGSSNSAGRNNTDIPNPLGSGQSHFGRMWQMGDDNSIDILQNGRANGIIAHKGISYNGNPYDNGNFYQIGNWNAAKITQTSGGSSGGNIDEINQIASDTATGPTNKLTITQAGAANGSYGFSSSDYNYAWNFVRTVNQTHTGGAMNELTLTQTGAIYARENKIARADQNGSGNTGTITQTGYLNYAWLSQTGDTNAATVSLTGNGNGSAAVSAYPPRSLTSGSFSSGGFAAAVGVGTGTVTQNSDANTLSYTVLGDNNLFGFKQQTGSGNAITGTATGNSNQIAILQDGGSNLASFVQTGVGNDLGISQTGDGNSATINATGDDNIVGVTQIATAAGINVLNVDIFGSNNGGGTFTVGGNAASLGLDAGTIYQENDGGLTNSIDLDVGDSGTPLSANLFALKQVGTGNTIIGSVSTGDGNEVAVLQDGNGNTANFTQSGGGNNISISQ